MKLHAMIVQAVWESKSTFLMLPHITQDNLRHFTTKKVLIHFCFSNLSYDFFHKFSILCFSSMRAQYSTHFSFFQGLSSETFIIFVLHSIERLDFESAIMFPISCAVFVLEEFVVCYRVQNLLWNNSRRPT